MAPNLDDVLMQQIVCISGAKQNRFGTGFVAHITSEEAFIVTCRHVIDDVGGVEQLYVNGQEAALLISDSPDASDLAVLKTPMKTHWSALSLCSHDEKLDSNFVTAGYRMTANVRAAKHLKGRIVERQYGIAPNSGTHYPLWELELDEQDVLQQGYSGAPVINSTGNVVAVIRVREDQGRTGLAVGINALTGFWLEMPSELRGALEHDAERTGSGVSNIAHMNRLEELDRFTKIMKGTDRVARVVQVHGESRSGKTRLTKEFQRIAESHGKLTIRYDFKSETSPAVEILLDRLAVCLDPSCFPRFDEARSTAKPESINSLVDWHANMTRRFFTDLREWKGPSPVVLFLDHYERADHNRFREWLTGTFIPHLKWSPLILVVAGQDMLAEPDRWGELWTIELLGVKVEDYRKYADSHDVEIPDEDLRKLHRMVNGRPGEFVQYIEGERSR